MTNHSRNELPLMRPMTPPASPKNSETTMNAPPAMRLYLSVRTAQNTPMIAMTTAAMKAMPVMNPITTLNRNHAATARTRMASTRAPKEDERDSSMPLMVRLLRPAGGGHAAVSRRGA